MLPILVALATAILAGLATAAQRPDVVVVVADDLGYGGISAHGHPLIETPRLDELARQSTSFERFYVSPTGAPTRAALLTGRHGFRVGVSHLYAGRSLLAPGFATLAEVFRDQGYETAIFGKWQLGDAYPCRPEDRGFGEVLVHGGGGIGRLPDFWGNRANDIRMRTREGWEETAGDAIDVVFERAIDWLGRERDQPVLVWLAPDLAPRAGAMGRMADRFHAKLARVDQGVGRLLAAIEGRDTIVVFLGDNGPVHGGWNAGMKGRRADVHEGGVRVPCFIRWSGRIAAGREVRELAGQGDLMPTLAALCGVDLADDEPGGAPGEGIDLSASLLGREPFPAGRVVFSHRGCWPGDESPARHRSRGFAVRDPRWRLVGLELYDMQEDPGETRNVFAENQGEATRLLADYGRWWESVSPGLDEAVRYQLDGGGVTRLTAHDWWPSREFEADAAIARQAQLVDLLGRLQRQETRHGIPSRTGHWKLQVNEAGHYRVRFGLLPPEAGERDELNLGRLRAGIAHLRAGRDELQLAVAEDATALTAGVDLAAGPVELEIWFSGQLDDEAVLGAFFAELERVGPRRIPELEFEIRPDGKN